MGSIVKTSFNSIYFFNRIVKKYFLIIFLLLSAKLYSQSPPTFSINALHFDGINDFVTVGYANYLLGTSSDFTLEAWIRDERTGGGNTEEVILSDQPASSANGFRMEILNGVLTTFVAGNSYSSGSADLRDNSCHHVAVTRQAGILKHYVDGILTGPAFNSTDNAAMTDAILIGIRRINAGLTGSFQGLIKEVRVWGNARSQSQIQYGMNMIPWPESNLPPGYWRFEEGAGQVIGGDGNVSPPGVLGATASAEITDPVWTTGCPNCFQPSASIFTNGSTILCPAGFVTINAMIDPGYSYQWKRNGIVITGATASSYAATSTGNYNCVVTNSCGTSTSNTITISAASSPAAVITSNGNTTFCSGGSVALSANTGLGLLYQWKRNGTNISGAINSAISATVTGNYTCVVSNACFSTTSNAIAVTVNSVPALPGSITGPVSVCRRQNNVTYSIAPVSGATSYTWTIPSQAHFNSGQGTTSINIKFGNNSGNISVKANNACGTGATRSLAVSMPCRESLPGGNPEVTVFPNPSADHFTLRLISGEGNNSVLILKDMTGKEVERIENISADDVDVDFGSRLASGIYMAMIIQDSGITILRLIKN